MKKKIVIFVSFAIIAFFIGTSINFNLLTMAGKPVTEVGPISHTYVVFDTLTIEPGTEKWSEPVDIDGFKTIHVFVSIAGFDEVGVRIWVVIINPNTGLPTDYQIDHFTAEKNRIHTYTVSGPMIKIQVWSMEEHSSTLNEMLVYATTL